VRLAALDLREISGVDLEDLGLDLEIPGIPCFSLKFMCFSLESPHLQDVSLNEHYADLCKDPGYSLGSLPGSVARAYPSSGFEHLLVPSRLAFLQRSASGTVLPAA